MSSHFDTGPKCLVRAYRHENRLLVMLGGSLILQNCEPTRDSIKPLVEAPELQRVDLYLGHLGFVDSSGLGVLVGFQAMMRKRKVELRMLCPTENLRRLFEATRLNEMFQLVEGPAGEALRVELERDEYRAHTTEAGE